MRLKKLYLLKEVDSFVRSGDHVATLLLLLLLLLLPEADQKNIIQNKNSINAVKKLIIYLE
jgi:hypothetical protein